MPAHRIVAIDASQIELNCHRPRDAVQEIPH
jgi:hypothetical protein